jgi:galactokinase
MEMPHIYMKEVHKACPERSRRDSIHFRDVLEFTELLQDRNSVVYSPDGFDNDKDVIIVRAPARLDLMGGIADYCGSNVFEATLSNSLIMGSQLRNDRQFKVLSIGAERYGLKPSFSLSISDLYDGSSIKEYSDIRELFRRDKGSSWAGYCLGALYVLLKEGKVDAFERGMNIVIKSNIPLGAGISSSAALEIAAMASASVQYKLELDPLDFAGLAQIAENKVVGAPCGIMDQITSAIGEEGKVISILCQPGEILEWVELPENVQVIGINSGVKRSTGGSAYIDARTAAFMGLTIISDNLCPGRDSLDGYLCNISPEELREKYWNSLPGSISGAEFLDRYGDTIDPVTTVDPDKIYMVRSRSEHPIYENQRVGSFIKYLKAAGESRGVGTSAILEELIKAGKLMYASHWSYRQKVGLGSRNVDTIASKIRNIGPAGGFLGAKITGGGAGGTAAVLCYGDFSDSLCQVLDHYRAETGIDAQVFTGSSPGAFKFGYLRVVIRNPL